MMKTLIWSLSLAMASSCMAEEFALEYNPADSDYAIYGGGIGDPVKPTANDAKISFLITGIAAKKMFNAIPPDRKEGCTSKDFRIRSRDSERLICTKHISGDYSCYFGFDLKTGKSIGGSSC